MFLKKSILTTILLTLSAFGNEPRTNSITLAQQKMLNIVNEYRSHQVICTPGSKPVGPSKKLIWNDNLASSAFEHSYDLALSNTFSHLGSGTKYDISGHGHKSLFYERIISHGYKNYEIVGENIAGGQDSLSFAMKELMKSPLHCENIMNPLYTDFGMALFFKKDSEYFYYWTQNFGTLR